MKSYLLAGVSSGAVGLMVFLVAHHIWIMPIWFIAPVGLVIAALGGMAVGWAYAEVHPKLPPRWWAIISLMVFIILVLLPAIIMAEVREPMFDVSVPGGLLIMSVERAALIFTLELLVPAILVGGLVGWMICRTPRATISTALAGFVFAIGPGHNIPFLGNTPGALKGVIILMAITLVSAIVLVKIQSKLT